MVERLGQVGALAMLVSILGSGCADGTWGRQRQERPAPVVADKPVQQETEAPDVEAPGGESYQAAGATAENADGEVSDFIHRLQRKARADSDRVAESPDVAAASAEYVPTGTASTSANMAVALPEPGQEEQWALPPKKPTEATEAPRVEAVTIVGAVPGPEEEAETRTLSTNEPLDATAVAEEFSIRKYIKMLEDALQTDPADVELQWLLSTMRLVMGEKDKATEISHEIAREPAELLRDAVRLFADMRQLLVDPSHPADETLVALEALRTKLRERAELVIPAVALCTRVRTFGVYDEMPPGQLTAYQTNRTVVYTEVKNFVSKKLADGQYETLLAGRLELLTRDGRLVWHHEESSIKEVSKQRREDFFLAQLVTFPPDLSPGDYVLKVMIQDLLGGKANEAHVEFSIGQPQLSSTSR